MLAPFFESISGFFSEVWGATWSWFSSLSVSEWPMVLGVFCVIGFLIIRGFGNKSRV